MSWEIAVAGTLIVDDITTPRGHRGHLLGGSALYFTLAARDSAPVHVHGIIGQDTQEEYAQMLEHPNVRTEGIQPQGETTRRWKARHDFQKWVAVVEGPYGGSDRPWGDDWDARLTPSGREAEVLFVGSMSPGHQLEVIRQSGATLVACDFMRHFITDEQAAVREVLARSDVLFVNHEELALLAGANSRHWRVSAKKLIEYNPRLRAVVVKAGPHGAALVTRGLITKRPAVKVVDVIDPTGAGDSLAGGFLGYCAQMGADTEWTFLQALNRGLDAAGRAISSFGTGNLRSVSGNQPAVGQPPKGQVSA
jgi:cytidine kinase